MKHTVIVRNGIFEDHVDIELDKSTADWSGSDISHLFAKVEFPLQAQGPAFPKEVEELPGSRFTKFTVKSPDGNRTAQVMVEGVPDSAISEWRQKYDNSPKPKE